MSILIEKSAEEQHVSPSLLQAVILTESKFDAKAVSHVGAVGMMQLMPETAEWISEESGLPADDLNRPDENIPLGAWYLNFLLKKYHNNEVLALAAYNAGRGNVDEWVEKYNWGEGFSKVDEIPFPETREFVKTVVSARDRLEAERKEKEKEKNGS
ncbi:MAG: lytic transglycosylase domain-containing protein [Veillonellaceae bacterium]|nr:MAG: lytic transglycosylase domain-containing protein [Veillonellaceae bacterium]